MKIPNTFIPNKDLEENVKKLLEDRPILKKQEEELKGIDLDKHLSLLYENITPRELKICAYPEDTFSHLILTFEHERVEYQITYSYRGSNPLLEIVKRRKGTSFTEDEKKDFKKLTRFISSNHFAKIIRASSFKLPYFFIMYGLPSKIKTDDVATQIENFYQPNFQNVLVKEVRFCPVSEGEKARSNLPDTKIKKVYLYPLDY